MGDGRTAHRVGAVGVLAAVQFVVVVDETTVALLAPAVAADLGLGDEARHLLVTPFAAAFVLALPLTALLLSSRRPDRLLAPATLLFALSAATGAAAHSAAWLVATRAAQGATAALVTSCVLACLHAVTRGHPRRSADFSLFSLVSGAGSVAALVVAGPLATVSWRLCPLLIGIAAALGALGWHLVGSGRREDPGPPSAGTDPPPETSPSAATGDGPASTRPRSTTVRTASSLAAVVAGNAGLTLTVVTTSFALQSGLGWSPAASGLGFLPLNAAAAVGALVVALGATRLGHTRVLVAGLVCLAAGVAALAWAPGGTAGHPPDSPPLALLGLSVLVGLGIGVVFPLASEGGLATADESPLRRSAVVGLAQQAGIAAGAVSASTQSATTTLCVAAALLGLAGVLAAVGRTATAADAGPPPTGTPPGAERQ